jgi:phosphatidylglycerol:prolipoprotein diacylglycerol transferase
MIWNIDPTLIQLGPLEIRYYGLFFALGLMGSYALARKLCSIKKLSLTKLDDLVVYLMVGLVLGARFGHIAFYNMDYYLSNPAQILQIWNGGLSSHGAIIGLLVAYGIFLWRHKVKTFEYADVIAVAAAIPIFTIRLGNFFNSEIVGRAWDGPWSVVFERVDSVPRHPSQIYEALIGLAILGFMWISWKKNHKKAHAGYFLGLFFVVFSISRFLVEFFKEYPLNNGLTTGQWLSIPFLIFGIALLLNGKNR